MDEIIFLIIYIFKRLQQMQIPNLKRKLTRREFPLNFVSKVRIIF